LIDPLAGFEPAHFVVELEQTPTPEGISSRLADCQTKRNQVVTKLQELTGQLEYKSALLKIEKAQAMQGTAGTVAQREAEVEIACAASIKEIAQIKSGTKILGHLLENLNSIQVALSSQLKALSIQVDLTRT